MTEKTSKWLKDIQDLRNDSEALIKEINEFMANPDVPKDSAQYYDRIEKFRDRNRELERRQEVLRNYPN